MSLTRVTNTMMDLSVAPDATTTALGLDALVSNTTGQYNTAVGIDSLKQNNVGEQNTAVGYQTLYYAQKYKNPFYPVPDPDPANEYLETSGNVAIGFQAGYAIEGGNYNVAIGHTAIGVYTPYGAGPFGPAQGSGNIAIGASAIAQNFTGEQNVAIGGGGVMQYNSSGSNNVAIGWMSMLGDSVNSSVGGENVAVGAFSLKNQQGGDRNTAIGTNALETLNTGDDNTAVGYEALNLLTTGDENSALGLNSLSAVTSGIGNSALGKDAGAAITNGVYNTAIGFGAMAAGLPTGASGTSNVAIGADALSKITTGSFNLAAGPATGSNLTSGFANVMLGGYSASGTYAPIFDVTTEYNRVAIGSTATTNAYIQVAWTVVSDERDKTEIAPIAYGLDFVNKLNPVSYKFRVERNSHETVGGKRYGFLAQEVLKLEGDDPVIIDAENKEKLRYNGESLVPILVKAIQELKAEFDAYKASHS